MKNELVSKSKFTSIYKNSFNSIIEQVWTNESGGMSDENYKDEMLRFLKYFKEFNYSKFYVDARNMNYMVAPDTQEWVDENITKEFMVFIKKAAFTLPKDIFEEASIVQTTEESEAAMSRTRYFSDNEEAYKWLLED